MNCPRCGQPLESPTDARCAHCGQLIGPSAWSNPASATPITPSSPSASRGAEQYGVSGQYGAGEYGVPAAPSYEGASAPSYPGPQSGPAYGPPPYGQSVPLNYPSYPSYPGYPPPYTPPPWGAPPTVPIPGWGGPPPMPPPRRSRTGLIVGISVGVAVFLILAVAGGAALVYLRSGQNVASATPTTTAALPSPTPQETIVYQDSLTSDTGGWTIDPPYCQFANGGFQVSDGYLCFAPSRNIGDANITVQARQVQGATNHSFGIGFRRVSKGNDYAFVIDGNGDWYFGKEVNYTYSSIVDWTASSAINSGLNVTNTLLVRAKGTHFDFFVNGTKVGEASDSTYTFGRTGLGAGNTIQVVYNNIKITTSP
jgi:hypothetical protein